MSDMLFVFLMTLSIYLMFFDKIKKQKYLLFFAGLLLGFATLVRTISIFLPVVFAGYYFFINRNKITLKQMAVLLSIFALGFVAMLFPWMMRNKAHSGVFTISSLGGYNLFSFNVPYFLMNKNNISFEEATSIMYKETNIPSTADAMQPEKLKELSAAMKSSKKIRLAMKLHLSRLPQFWRQQFKIYTSI
jgi:hypothetical protein